MWRELAWACHCLSGMCASLIALADGASPVNVTSPVDEFTSRFYELSGGEKHLRHCTSCSPSEK